MKFKALGTLLTHPFVGAPVSAGISAMNIISILPTAINILTAIYLAMLVIHKGWAWWKEYKGKIPINDEDSLP